MCGRCPYAVWACGGGGAMTVLLRRTSHITSGISRIQQTNRVFRSRAEMPDLSSYAQGIQTSKTFVVSAGTGGLGKLRRPAHESTVNLAPPESRRNVNSWVPGSMVSSFCAFSICSWATSHTPRKEKKPSAASFLKFSEYQHMGPLGSGRAASPSCLADSAQYASSCEARAQGDYTSPKQKRKSYRENAQATRSIITRARKGIMYTAISGKQECMDSTILSR